MSQWTGGILAGADIIVLAGYLVVMMVVGILCRRMSSNISDYIRMGCKGTWWLVGLSVFMQSFSAATFTGYCGQAFLAGWSVMLVFWGNALMFFLQAAFFAPWLRQTRAITPADAIRQRYGAVVEQIFLYFSIPGGLCWSGMFLLTLATFFAAMFNLPLEPTMVIIAVVLIFYSVSGGSWSVQITDALQSFILMPVTIAVAGLCLLLFADDGGGLIAGARGLLARIAERGLSDDFRLIKPSNFVYPKEIGKSIGAGFFTTAWVVASIFNVLLSSANITTCYRYLSNKNGQEARKAAMLAGILMIIGSFVWFIPPVAGRLLYEKEILAMGRGDTAVTAPATPAPENAPAVSARSVRPQARLDSAADGAYAFMTRKVLPPGMIGLILIAMASAAMSSMDSNLTGTAGLLTNNILPPLARRFRRKPPEGERLLRITKWVNLGLGAWALFMAFVFHSQSNQKGIFGLMLNIFAFIGAPVGMPMVVSFFLKRIPKWAPLVGMGGGYLVSAFYLLQKAKTPLPFGLTLPTEWHNVIFIQAAVTILPTALMRVFWSTASPEYRAQVDEFFRRIRTPVDYEREVGADESHVQMKMVGWIAVLMGGALMGLIFFGRNTAERVAAMFVACSVLVLGLLLYVGGLRRARRSATASPPTSVS